MIKINYQSIFSKTLCALLTLLLFLNSSLYGQPLQEFIETGITNSSRLKALKLEYCVSEERITAIKRLPNTNFDTGYFLKKLEIRTGTPKAKFSVKQSLQLKFHLKNIEAIKDFYIQTAVIEYITS